MKQDTVIIRKYENRRLYDTSASRYINLEEVAAMIRQGRDLQVLDAKTGEDLTRLVLTQIITEDARGRPAGLPLELLRQLIIATDQAGQEFLMWYLRSAFETYHKVQDSVQSGLSEVGSAALAPFQKMRNLISGALGSESAAQAGVGAEPRAPARAQSGLASGRVSSEVEDLRRRVAELEGLLKQHRGRSRKKKPRPTA